MNFLTTDFADDTDFQKSESVESVQSVVKKCPAGFSRGLLFSCALLWLAPVQADLVIVQHVDGSGQSGDQTIKIKGDKARTDLASQVSMITDGASGDMVTLMHAQKAFLKVSAAQTKAMMEQLQVKTSHS